MTSKKLPEPGQTLTITCYCKLEREMCPSSIKTILLASEWDAGNVWATFCGRLFPPLTNTPRKHGHCFHRALNKHGGAARDFSTISHLTSAWPSWPKKKEIKTTSSFTGR